MAPVLQCRHRPSCFALCRLSFSAFLWASRCSGRCRRRSYSRWFSGLVIPLAGGWDLLALLTGRGLATFRGFGSDVALDFPGFVRCRLSQVLSRVGIDAGLLAGSYLPPNLLGSGTRSEKVAPTTLLGGGTLPARLPPPVPPGLSPRGRGNHVTEDVQELLAGSIPRRHSHARGVRQSPRAPEGESPGCNSPSTCWKRAHAFRARTVPTMRSPVCLPAVGRERRTVRVHNMQNPKGPGPGGLRQPHPARSSVRGDDA